MKTFNVDSKIALAKKIIVAQRLLKENKSDFHDVGLKVLGLDFTDTLSTRMYYIDSS